MRVHRVRYALCCFAAALIIPSAASADVRIYLRNGMIMTAESCEKEEGQLTCYRMGGAFQIAPADVERIEKTDAASSGEEQPAMTADAAPPAAAQDKEKGKDAAPTPEQRFNEIQQRKQELQKERDTLVQDREKLREDVKKSSDWMTQQQYGELDKRNKEIEERLKKFNEEAKRLNEEQKNIPGVQPAPAQAQEKKKGE